MCPPHGQRDTGHCLTLSRRASSGVFSSLAFSQEDAVLRQQILTTMKLWVWEQSTWVLFLAWKACEIAALG